MHHLIVVPDCHINSTVALCAPNIDLDDGGSYVLSPSQRRLWHDWREFIEFCKGLEGTKHLILNGDTIEADAKNRSHQVITRNRATIIGMAAKTLDTLLQVVDTIDRKSVV